MADVKVPETRGEFEWAIMSAIQNMYNYPEPAAKALAPLVMDWLSAVRVAEPRLRPVSETPQIGDFYTFEHENGSCGEMRQHVSEKWDPSIRGKVIGWRLVKRAPKPPSLRERAEALGEMPFIRCPPNFETDNEPAMQYITRANALRNAVLGWEPKA